MSNEFLATMPSINFPRSSWKQHFVNPTSWKHGQLVPIDCFQVLSGDTFKLKLKSLIRMNTPIVPILSDDLECEINAWFVPDRLLWEHQEEFYGANKTSAGAQKINYKVPHRSIYDFGIEWDSIGAYLGKPIVAQSSSKGSAGYGMASVMKERGYFFIWSECYRAGMIQNPFILNRTDSEVIGSINGTYLTFNSKLKNVCKNMDYFVGALTEPLYGSTGVSMPLGDFAPIVAVNSSGATVNANTNIVNATTMAAGDASVVGLSGHISHTEVLADLRDSAKLKIDSIKSALALETFLEIGNFGGNFYWSILKAHTGVTPPDSSLQRPERLGTVNFKINVAQVTAMADTTQNGAIKPAGSVGAVSVTGNTSHLFTKAFCEPGIVYVLLHTRQSKQSYCQGLLREDTKFDRIEFYSPEFANLPDQEIKNKEIFLSGSDVDEEVFGYQEYASEYRYRTNRATGILNPNAGSSIALPYWTLTNVFGSLPTLNDAFVEESRDNLARCLITGINSTHDYIGEFDFEYTAVREMPVHVRPGIVDSYFGR